jgi:hypothetical protein
VLSSPRVVRPTARVTAHRKKKMTTARSAISMGAPQGTRCVVNETLTTGAPSTTTETLPSRPRWADGWM